MDVQDFLLEYLCRESYYKKAIFWAKVIGISEDKWPGRMKAFAFSHKSDMEELEVEVGRKLKIEQERRDRRYDNCYLFEGNCFPIYMVDTKELLEAVVDDIMRCDIIGVDCEWRPVCLTMTEQLF